jgi:hypothetical protein
MSEIGRARRVVLFQEAYASLPFRRSNLVCRTLRDPLMQGEDRQDSARLETAF